MKFLPAFNSRWLNLEQVVEMACSYQKERDEYFLEATLTNGEEVLLLGKPEADIDEACAQLETLTEGAGFVNYSHRRKLNLKLIEEFYIEHFAIGDTWDVVAKTVLGAKIYIDIAFETYEEAAKLIEELVKEESHGN